MTELDKSIFQFTQTARDQDGVQCLVYLQDRGVVVNLETWHRSRLGIRCGGAADQRTGRDRREDRQAETHGGRTPTQSQRIGGRKGSLKWKIWKSRKC